jgi:hypothetical protein
MPFEIRIDAAQLQQFLARKQAGFRPGGVKDRRGVPLGEHEAIVVGVLRILRVVVHLGVEERRYDLGCREAARRMAAASLAGRSH